MTKKELIAEAKKRGLMPTSSMTKDMIEGMIKHHDNFVSIVKRNRGEGQ